MKKIISSLLLTAGFILALTPVQSFASEFPWDFEIIHSSDDEDGPEITRTMQDYETHYYSGYNPYYPVYYYNDDEESSPNSNKSLSDDEEIYLRGLNLNFFHDDRHRYKEEEEEEENIFEQRKSPKKILRATERANSQITQKMYRKKKRKQDLNKKISLLKQRGNSTLCLKIQNTREKKENGTWKKKKKKKKRKKRN